MKKGSFWLLALKLKALFCKLVHTSNTLYVSFAGMTLNTCIVLLRIEMFCLFDLILYVTSTIFKLYKDGSSLVEPVLS